MRGSTFQKEGAVMRTPCQLIPPLTTDFGWSPSDACGCCRFHAGRRSSLSLSLSLLPRSQNG